MKTFNYVSLFSGIGGFEKGIENSGVNWNCVGYSEINHASLEIYKKHFPEHKSLGNVKNLNAQYLKNLEVDCVVGGFPCQSWSQAGKRKGFGDDRGMLFYNVLDVIEASKPKVVFLENVENLVRHNYGRSLQRIVRMISDLGYDVNWEVLNTADFGIPHRRTRVFFVAFRKDLKVSNFEFPLMIESKKEFSFYDFLEELPPEYVYLNKEESLKMKGWGTQNGHGGYISDNRIYNCITASYKKDHGNSMKFLRSNGKLSCLSPIEAERLQGFPDNWTEINGVSFEDRYKSLGNAVSVPVIKEIVLKIEDSIKSDSKDGANLLLVKEDVA